MEERIVEFGDGAAFEGLDGGDGRRRRIIRLNLYGRRRRLDGWRRDRAGRRRIQQHPAGGQNAADDDSREHGLDHLFPMQVLLRETVVKCLAEFIDGLEAFVRFRGACAFEETVEGAHGRIVHEIFRNLRKTGGRIASDAAVNDHTERIKIPHFSIDLFAFQQRRRAEAFRSGEGKRWIVFCYEAEIAEFRFPVDKEDVGRFDIAMDKAMLVKDLESVQKAIDTVLRFFECETPFMEAVFKRVRHVMTAVAGI